MAEYSEKTNVNDIDWNSWIPAERAVLCFIKVDNRLMLIHKKRGLGKGKVNAPGGRIEKDELPVDAAVRETQEEIGLTPYNLVEMGELHFIFTDGYSLHGVIFFADSYSGTPVETDEAVPFWCDIDKVPYEDMWEDDHFWLPLLLSGQKMKGYFIFDNDKMLSHCIEII
ncbi:MAG: 8-oxo-dGTP diphosphatase [Fibrobacter sp.]|nr:8-oxo-dGTP diphosphatase [Fibrobacter sp.]